MMINVDGHRISAKRFRASKGLQVQGWLDLRGTGITALPDGLTHTPATLRITRDRLRLARMVLLGMEIE